MKRIVPIIILCIGVVAASPALCQKKKAKVLFDAGVTALEQKDYSKALQSFQDAYSLSPHWAVLAHIGTCYARLDQPEKAIQSFQTYLEEGGKQIPPDERKTAEEMIVQQKRKLGTLVLSVGKDGVEALIDGESIGKSPFNDIVLSPGLHEIAVIFGPSDIVKRKIDLLSGQEFILRIEQEKHVSTAPETTLVQESESKPKKSETKTSQMEETNPVFSAPPSSSEKVKGSAVPFGLSLGLTIADLIATGVSWGLFSYYNSSAKNYKNDLDLQVEIYGWDFTWEETCSQIKVSTKSEEYYCNTELNRRDFVKKADTWKIVGIATSAALGVTLTTTLIFGLNRHWFGGSKNNEAALSFIPFVSPKENGFVLSLSF